MLNLDDNESPISSIDEVITHSYNVKYKNICLKIKKLKLSSYLISIEIIVLDIIIKMIKYYSILLKTNIYIKLDVK